ncbi:hypothetical protein [Paraglaciecola sp. MB-3u-78]|nr:hypothetical protein [Paraglaciecola sp. MB-3u-78]
MDKMFKAELNIPFQQNLLREIADDGSELFIINNIRNNTNPP